MLLLKKVVREEVDSDGVIHREIQLVHTNQSLNIGSINNPKATDIIEVKWIKDP